MPANSWYCTFFYTLLIVSGISANVAPEISIISPTDNALYLEGKPIIISAIASDLIGFVDKVEFYVNDEIIGSLNEALYTINWTAQPRKSLTDSLFLILILVMI